MNAPARAQFVPVQHIQYNSPYGGHGVLRRRGRDAYDAVIEFLRVCTDWDGSWDRPYITVASPGQWSPPDWDPAPVRRELAQRLGADGRFSGGISHALTTGAFEAQHAWDIPANDYDWALAFVLDRPKCPADTLPPITMTVATEARLRVPGGDVLPGQAPAGSPPGSVRSTFMLHIEPGKVGFSLTLEFPHAEPDAAFVDHVRQIRAYLPVRLAKGNFHLCLPKKDGSGYRFRKVDKSLFKDI